MSTLRTPKDWEGRAVSTLDILLFMRQKKAFPPGGWAQRYLVDCQGDHRAAIDKFLDYAAEFVAQQERSSSD